jgi:hypothetical protein
MKIYAADVFFIIIIFIIFLFYFFSLTWVSGPAFMYLD